MIDNDIVITGAAGFIGQNLTKFLKKKKIKFRAYSRKKKIFIKINKKLYFNKAYWKVNINISFTIKQS